MTVTIQRLPELKAIIGLSRSSIYGHIAQGLFPKPIHIGSRAVGWLSHETDAIMMARVAGVSNDDIRALVVTLMSQRGQGGAK
jgi:prophage regulatory protein